MNITLAGLLVLAMESGGALAQNSAGAEARLKQLNITLPAPMPAIANYVGAVQVGNLLFVSRTIPGPEWQLLGKVGKDLTVEQGYQAARQVALNQLTTISAALGHLSPASARAYVHLTTEPVRMAIEKALRLNET